MTIAQLLQEMRSPSKLPADAINELIMGVPNGWTIFD